SGEVTSAPVAPPAPALPGPAAAPIAGPAPCVAPVAAAGGDEDEARSCAASDAMAPDAASMPNLDSGLGDLPLLFSALFAALPAPAGAGPPDNRRRSAVAAAGAGT